MVQKITYMEAKTPKGSAVKFSMPSDVHDIVTHANFYQDWSKGFSVARGRILAFSIDLRIVDFTTLSHYRFEVFEAFQQTTHEIFLCNNL